MKAPIFITALTFGLALPTMALGFCRTTTCAQENPPAECVPGVVIGSCQTAGKALKWPKSCVSFSVNKKSSIKYNSDGSVASEITANDLEDIVRMSFDNWQKADCPDGGQPNMTVETYAQVDCAEARYNQGGPNQNVWLFRDDAWPHAGDGDRTIALTLVSFQRNTGEIYDVDVELNSFQRTFTLETTGNGDDLQSVVQHESGHFLGLAHSDNSEATMWSNYNGSVDMRTLEPDDAAGMCAAYPPVAKKAASCDATPRHGFSTQCTKSDEKNWLGCSLGHIGTSTSRLATGLWLAALSVLMLRKRRRIGNV